MIGKRLQSGNPGFTAGLFWGIVSRHSIVKGD
jgi:hypothetical protein